MAKTSKIQTFSSEDMVADVINSFGEGDLTVTFMGASGKVSLHLSGTDAIIPEWRTKVKVAGFDDKAAAVAWLRTAGPRNGERFNFPEA